MITIDPSGPQTPSVQLQAQLMSSMRSGELRAGSRLPAVRQLAADLGLGNGTVAKVYKALEELGWVETRRGGGTTVRAGLAEAADVSVEAAGFVDAARAAGLGLDEAVALIAARWRGDGAE